MVLFRMQLRSFGTVRGRQLVRQGVEVERAGQGERHRHLRAGHEAVCCRVGIIPGLCLLAQDPSS